MAIVLATVQWLIISRQLATPLCWNRPPPVRSLSPEHGLGQRPGHRPGRGPGHRPGRGPGRGPERGLGRGPGRPDTVLEAVEDSVPAMGPAMVLDTAPRAGVH